MGQLLKSCAFQAGQELPAGPWLAALREEESRGIASSALVGNFLSASLTLPCNENSSNPKASK